MKKQFQDVKLQVEAYLRSLPSNHIVVWNFSEQWLVAASEKVSRYLESREIVQEDEFNSQVRKIHMERFEQLKKNAINSLYTFKFSMEDKQDLLNTCLLNFLKSFDGKKSIEQTFLNLIIRKSALSYKESRDKKLEKRKIDADISEIDERKEFEESFQGSTYLEYMSKYVFEATEYHGQGLAAFYNFLSTFTNVIPQKEHSGGIDLSMFKDLGHFIHNPNFLEQHRNPQEIKHEKQVKGYARYQMLIESDERQFMFRAAGLVEKCSENFHNNLLPHMLAKEDEKQRATPDYKKKNKSDLVGSMPLLSAIAVDDNGQEIAFAYKGMTGDMSKHCEYTLLQECMDEVQLARLKGGTLYVTLEPCNSRKPFVNQKGLDEPKIPCAVRCAISGAKTIYIGTQDTNATVEGKGIEILRTGLFNFPKPIPSDLNALYIFCTERYPIVEQTETSIQFRISEELDVRFFHTDITRQITSMNKAFLEYYKPEDQIFLSP